jgi:hypothetical protein
MTAVFFEEMSWIKKIGFIRGYIFKIYNYSKEKMA